MLYLHIFIQKTHGQVVIQISQRCSLLRLLNKTSCYEGFLGIILMLSENLMSSIIHVYCVIDNNSKRDNMSAPLK